MSWLISRAMTEACVSLRYSQESEGGSLEGTCSDGEQSAPLSVMPTPHKFWRNDKTMEFSRLSQFGLTCAVLTEGHGEELLTSFREGFRARTYRLQEQEKDSMETGLVYGVKWVESLAKYDLGLSTWKTQQCLWEEDLPSSSVILPKWGMTRSGALFQHPMLERPISEIGSGLWQRMWPTPVASMSKGSSPGSLIRKCGRDRSNDRLDHAVMASDGGQLNPEWVEWMMGVPSKWTDLRPLAMDKFQEWLQQHSISSQAELDE